MWWMGHAWVVVCVVFSGVWGQPFTLSALKWPDLQRRCRRGQLLSRSAYTRQVYKRLWGEGGIFGDHLGLGSKPRPRRRRGCRHRPVRVSGTRARGMCVRARGVRARSLCGVTCVIASFHGYGLIISSYPSSLVQSSVSAAAAASAVTPLAVSTTTPSCWRLCTVCPCTRHHHSFASRDIPSAS